jgi:SAM-dependent methyltransferase
LVRPEQIQYNEKGSVIANWAELPFAPDSIDLIVLSHVFERIDNAQALLKEVNTVLRHDGKLLISGFNPGRLRARNLAKCYHTKAAHLKLCSTVMFILQKEGFEVKQVCHYGFFRIRNKTLAKYINKLCRLFSPGLACGYLIVAEKKVLAAIAAKPDWKNPLLEPEKIRLPTSCRVKK